jgi:predicted AAA+ superfamily ATPase
VWGSAEKVETIWVNDKPLKITASLFSALRDLRGETRSFILWADGICINQNDDKEKRVQIQLTGRIYVEASNMIIYLGLGNPNGKKS